MNQSASRRGGGRLEVGARRRRPRPVRGDAHAGIAVLFVKFVARGGAKAWRPGVVVTFDGAWPVSGGGAPQPRRPALESLRALSRSAVSRPLAARGVGVVRCSAARTRWERRPWRRAADAGRRAALSRRGGHWSAGAALAPRLGPAAAAGGLASKPAASRRRRTVPRGAAGATGLPLRGLSSRSPSRLRSWRLRRRAPSARAKCRLRAKAASSSATD